MATMTITAGELVAGMQVCERDGYVLHVWGIVAVTAKTITVRVGARMSTTMRQPSDVRLRKASRVDVVAAVVTDCGIDTLVPMMS